MNLPQTTVDITTVDLKATGDREAAMTGSPNTEADQDLYKQDLKNLLAYVDAKRSFETNGGFPWPNLRPSLIQRIAQLLHLNV